MRNGENMRYEVGNFVELESPHGTELGQIVGIDYKSVHNSYRKHPDKYPIVVKLGTPFNVFNTTVEYLTFDESGYATKWERLAGVNKLRVV